MMEEKILVVEPHDDMRDLVGLMLRRLGCEEFVLEKKDWQKSLADADSPFSVIIAARNAVTLTDLIEGAKHHSPHARIIVMTTDPSEEHREALKGLGVNFVLVRPFDVSDLKLALE